MMNKKKEILIKAEIGTAYDLDKGDFEDQINQGILAAENNANHLTLLR